MSSSFKNVNYECDDECGNCRKTHSFILWEHHTSDIASIWDEDGKQLWIGDYKALSALQRLLDPLHEGDRMSARSLGIINKIRG